MEFYEQRPFTFLSGLFPWDHAKLSSRSKCAASTAHGVILKRQRGPRSLCSVAWLETEGTGRKGGGSLGGPLGKVGHSRKAGCDHWEARHGFRGRHTFAGVLEGHLRTLIIEPTTYPHHLAQIPGPPSHLLTVVCISVHHPLSRT